MGSKGKVLVLILTAVFLTSLITFHSATAEATSSRTIIVPDHYPTIQAAIDSASAGDTVFVKAGTYSLSSTILINKPISLIGENASTTIIDVQTMPHGVGIRIKAHNVTVSGFTIINCQDVGVLVSNVDGHPSYPSANCSIQGNRLLNGDYGIWVDGGIGFNFTNNEILNNKAGIFLYPTAMDGIIMGNLISGNNIGMSSVGDNITITENNFSANNEGINIGLCSQVKMYGNNVTDQKGTGISLGQYCDHTTVYENNITGNSVGIGIGGFHRPGSEIWALPELKEYYLSLNFSDNTVCMNNFVDNSEQALSVYPTDSGPVTFSVVSWDNGIVGNFWSDYKSKYPNATELENSGIGNLPYIIDENNTDHYPLIRLISTSTIPELPLLTIPILFIVMTSAGLLVYLKKHRKAV